MSGYIDLTKTWNVLREKEKCYMKKESAGISTLFSGTKVTKMG